ncbi:MAG: AAA family ATPase [Candidatus Altiarchaeales archaeon]|nr:AAA family ATPase [Candidatus Altiarchaeales archaeon]
MYFEKIQGHRGVLSLLKDLLCRDELDGFFLFTGPKSIGKYTVAKRLAQYATCIGTMEDACRCETCRLFPSIPDYLEIDDSASTIKTEDVLSIDEFLRLVPYKSSRRVVLVDDADRLHYAASDKLLKILEDLKKRCTVIFVTSQPEKMSPALLSRAETVNFQSLSPEEAIEVLKHKGYRIGTLGDLQRALPYLGSGVLQQPKKYASLMKSMPDFLGKMSRKGGDELFTLIKEEDDNGDLLMFTEILIILLNDLLKIHYDSPDVVVNVSRLDELEKLTSMWSDQVCIASLTKLSNAVRDYKMNLNLKKRSRLESAIAWMSLYLEKESSKKSKK